MQGKRELIKIFRTYYKLGIYQYVGISGHAIITGLIYKFNELSFPDSVKISVKEMLSLSGISDIRTFRNARTIITNYLHNSIDVDSWLVKYQEGGVKEYGIYQLNYVILLENYSNSTVILQESYSKNDRDRVKIAPDLLPKSAKNVLPSNTIQYNTIEKQNQTPAPVPGSNVLSNLINPSPEPTSVVSDPVINITEKMAEEFNWLNSQPPDRQLILIKAFSKTKLKAYEEWRSANVIDIQ